MNPPTGPDYAVPPSAPPRPAGLRTVRKHEPGGTLLSVPELWGEALQDLIDHAVGYVQVGAALLVVSLPLGFIVGIAALVVLYGGMGVGFFASAAGGAAIGDAAGDQDVGALASGLGMFGTLGCTFLAFFGLIALTNAVMAPVGASVTRAIAAHQRGDGELTFQSAFSTLKQDIGMNVRVMGAVTLASLLGVFLCYIGALVPAVLFVFAAPMVALHRVAAGEALRKSARTVLANPGHHLLFGLAYFVTAMIAAYVPILGYAFLMALGVRNFRKVHGDVAPA